MEHGNLLENREWVAEQFAYLDPPTRFDPDSVAALARFHTRKDLDKPSTLWPRWAAWAAATVLGLAMLVLLPPGRIAAQQLWQFLTVRQVAFIPVRAWPEGVPSPRVKLIEIVIPPIPARDVAEARWRVHYAPRLPRSGVLSGDPRLSTTFSMAAGTVVKVADLHLALRKSGLADQAVPQEWDGAQLALHTSAMVIAEWSGIALVQSLPLTLSAPPGFDFPAYSALVLRVLGVEPEQALRLARQMGTAPPWLAPIAGQNYASRSTLEEIALTTGPATLVQEKESDGTVKRTSIFWSVSDRVYLLSGTLSRELTILTANSVQ